MGLVDDLARIEPSPSGAVPLYRRLRAKLDDNERAAFDEALADLERVSAPQLSRTLREHGHPVSASSIRAWRRGEAL